jgi:hypothetical protein
MHLAGKTHTIEFANYTPKQKLGLGKHPGANKLLIVCEFSNLVLKD